MRREADLSSDPGGSGTGKRHRYALGLLTALVLLAVAPVAQGQPGAVPILPPPWLPPGPPPPGRLTQLAGSDGCVQESGDGVACADGKALRGARGLAVSPDGKHAYVASYTSGAVAVFSRDRGTGKLTQLAGTDGCVQEVGDGVTCTDGTALLGAAGVAVSPDGRHVYVASFDSNAVAIFSRNKTTGKLTQPAGADGCVQEFGFGVACAVGKGLARALGVAVSRDGRHVYVASATSSAVAIFSRDRTTGKLTQLAGAAGCVQELGDGVACVDGRALHAAAGLVVSQDGKHVYVASATSSAVAVFSRQRTTGELTQLPGADGCVQELGDGVGCVDGKALFDAIGVAMSQDGKNVYVASRFAGAMAIFSRDRPTGKLSQLADSAGCVQNYSGAPLASCTPVRVLVEPYSVVVSPDGESVYVASRVRNAVVVLSRDRPTGRLWQLAQVHGCVQEPPGSGDGCALGKALLGAIGVAVSPDGKNVYVASSGSDAIAAFSRE